MATSTADTPAGYPALKDIFDAAQFRRIGADVHAVWPAFDQRRFSTLALKNLDDLSVMQRVRRTSQALAATLPADFPSALAILREVAPRTERAFVALYLSDFVGEYGQAHYALSMDALAYFTRFGSAEFAIRSFLTHRLHDTLAVMRGWADDDNEHVRRLASEGSRPRLPWSFRLPEIVADPTLTAPILARLNHDPSLYVRKSVANHLNDITKDHPAWLLNLLQGWPRSDPHTAWITKHGLRSLVKAGDAGALALIGATGSAAVQVEAFRAGPAQLRLGQELQLAFDIRSTADTPQKIVVDYRIHYVKKSGGQSPKVFKLRTVEIAPHALLQFAHKRLFKDFSTRVHYAGVHRVELLVNGEVRADAVFTLQR